jgi:hypothetical protein
MNLKSLLKIFGHKQPSVFVKIFLHAVGRVVQIVCASARTARVGTASFTLAPWVADDVWIRRHSPSAHQLVPLHLLRSI